MNTERSGILVINKHAGVTSHDIVSAVRRLYGTKQVGHTGTLDPMATGVLPVLVGRAVKASDFLTAENKRYRALLRLGTETDTEDITGCVISSSDEIPQKADVIKACESFVGEIEQIPPMYSAIKIDGRKLVDIAREGGYVERKARSVTVNSIGVTPISERDYMLDVSCSKGTYIRTLCADIGRLLGCGGVMASLERTESGPFSVSDAVCTDELEKMTDIERIARLIPLERFFENLPQVVLPDFYAKLSRNGAEIYLSKIGVGFPLGQRVRLKNGGSFYAVGEVRDYPDGYAIKTLKLFVL